jgi:hypothetical protein
MAIRRTVPGFVGSPHLAIGNQVFHNGVPVQLLYRVSCLSDGEVWRVRPLFIEAPLREERFTCSDRISYLHTMRAPLRAGAR